MSVAPKRPKGPPLNAMRAFEAAARHVSFVAAAEELNVTAGAISQHIKILEDWAGVRLFSRNAQGVELTPAGLSLVADFTSAFDGLAQAARALRNLQPNSAFHIAALPSVAQLWLPSRLKQIRARFPEITFSVTAMETPPALDRELFDLSIFFVEVGETEDQVSLCRDEIVPVCALDLLEGTTADRVLAEAPRLQDQTWADDWALWARTAGVELARTNAGPQFSLYSLALEEAKAGAGVLIGHLCLIEDTLATGDLVRLHGTTADTGKCLAVQLAQKARRRRHADDIASFLKE